MKMNRGFAPVLWVLVAILLVSAAFAQETTAGLQGTVKDPQGLVVSKATVEVTGASLIGAKKVETDASGYYRFANLPPGDYVITVTAPNFRTLKQTGLRLEAGKLPTIDLKLEVGTLEQTVEVSSAAPIVDVTSSKNSTTVSNEVLDGIPKGRSFQSVIAFAPGARQEPLQSTSRGTGGFQIDGASDSENTYMMEGMDTTGIGGGGVGNNVPFEFVQEVQIKSGGFEAEYGGALGGVVNVIQKRGGNAWHGSAFSYLRTDALNANDACAIFTSCGLRYHPGSPNNFGTTATTAGRAGFPAGFTPVTVAPKTDQPVEYYVPKKDHRRIIEPGFEVGGYLLKDRLWLFSSYVPTMDALARTVTFGPVPETQRLGAAGFVASPNTWSAGPYTFRRNSTTHNALGRLDWLATQKIRTYAAWQYGYNRITGDSLPQPDAAFNSCLLPHAGFNNADIDATHPYGQSWAYPNTQCAGFSDVSATTNPATFRPDFGSVNPDNVFNLGADITITPKLIATARWGYWFTNTSSRGLPTGIRYLFMADGGAVGMPGLNFQNIASNSQTIYDAYKRKSISGDIAYFTKFAGTHNFKFGYSNNKLSNDLLAGYNSALVRMYPASSYSPNGGACPAAILAANGGQCRGTYGYYTIEDFGNSGNASSYNHSIYGQDAWTVGHGLTLNLGVRFDKEYLPPYSAGAPDISFGFGQKIAPRLGGAWDVLGNGKFKLYGSYGLFYDIMKYSLPRGSFGGDYWHNCVYTLDTTNYSSIQPAQVGGHTCAGTGDANGAHPGTLIENFNFRSVTLDPSNPGVDPDIKPMSQSDWALGADYALNPHLGLEVRYSRKRLRNTIEDIGIVLPGNELYYIGNPGTNPAYSDLLHRTLRDSSGYVPGDPTSVIDYPIQCATCPAQPKATRNYDGLEVRLTKRASDKWFGSLSYTYSRLWGNYAGLTSSDVNDAASTVPGAGGGRHNPNNNRSFDSPHMQFTAHGEEAMGLLATDRPHSFKGFAWYRMKWFHQETLIGFSQLAFSGTPITTCWPSVTTQSACQFVENRGMWVDITRDATTGALVKGSVYERRTPMFSQTDLNLVHEFKVSKTREDMRIGLEGNVTNLFNQHSVLSYMTVPLANTAHAEPKTPAGRPDWLALLGTGWDYTAVTNSQNKSLNNNYGKANLFQAARGVRLKVKFVF